MRPGGVLWAELKEHYAYGGWERPRTVAILPCAVEFMFTVLTLLRSTMALSVLTVASLGAVSLPAVHASDGSPFYERILIDNGVGTKIRTGRRAAEFAEDRRVQAAAMSLLVVEQDRKAVPILRRVLVAADTPNMRIGCTDDAETAYQEQLLIEHGLETTAKAVRRAAEFAEDSEVQAAAISILGYRGDRKAPRVLSRVLESSEDPWIRKQAALWLTRLGNQAGIAYVHDLLAAMIAGEEEARSDAASLAADLASTGDASGYPLVVRFSTSKSALDRSDAVHALPAFAGFPELDAVERLVAMASDPDASMRMEAVTWFSLACRNGAAKEPLLETLARVAETYVEPLVRERARIVLVSITTGKRMSCMEN